MYLLYMVTNKRKIRKFMIMEKLLMIKKYSSFCWLLRIVITYYLASYVKSFICKFYANVNYVGRYVSTKFIK